MESAEIIRILTANYPLEIWYIPSIVLVILGATALADAKTGRIPDVPLAFGVLLALCSLAFVSGWLIAGKSLLYVVAAVVILRLANNLYVRLFNHDAFGFGDVKWTGLAVAGFGALPVFWAWVVGAWLGLVWMGLRRLWHRLSPRYEGHAYVHFAPFLFLGLVLSLFKKPLLVFFLSLV